MSAHGLDDTMDFPKIEEEIIRFWDEESTFASIQAERKWKYENGQIEKLSIYDGPPFATGLPHYGHILSGTIKDTVIRYATQRGLHVERRFGWDCHGLPVEYEIDKQLGINSAQDVARIGIQRYNEACRQIVMRYANDWEAIVWRMGRWIDFRNDYKTMYPWFMESVWWVFSQLFAKGLVYKGTKIMPYSVGCRTPLSNFEAGHNIKDVVDDCITVGLEIVTPGEFYGSKLLIWTTNPWTLTANLSVCANAQLTYIKVRHLAKGNSYILSKNRLEAVFTGLHSSQDYTVSEEFSGLVLKDLRYKPLFDYYKDYGEKNNGFRVLLDNYVSDDTGTGLVHQAPYFGEDDFRVCRTNGIISNETPVMQPIDEGGKFTSEVLDLQGIYFKDANKIIINVLQGRDCFFSVGHIKHSYPFCWRSDTPLIYMAVPSWFVRVEHMVDDLLKNNAKSNWVPNIIKQKRFVNWLSSAHDWAISRNRYWGTPIPLWTSESGDEVVCISSISELERRTGVAKITDLHREFIDHLEIPSTRAGQPPLRRVSEVFDCWFESGSMPYAQTHYPFENESTFEESFPADFVAEGIDQTRGWFYTLLVLSTALFDKPPFKNLIVNGLVLTKDGQKMSKRKKNYPDPMNVVNNYGADALRFYLLNSPLVRAGNLSFQDSGVQSVTRGILIPWYNALRFLVQNIERFELEEKQTFYFEGKEIMLEDKHNDIFDQWFLSYNENLLQNISIEMTAYRLYKVTPMLVDFVDQLTNWYIRFKRKKCKGGLGTDVCKQSLKILFHIMLSMCMNMAAFTPFFSEFVYQKLRNFTTSHEINSIHSLKLPKPIVELINPKTELLMQKFQQVILLGRKLRERKNIPLKYPVKEILVLHTNKDYLQDMRRMETELLAELNCRQLLLTTDREAYGIRLKAEPNYKILGTRLRHDLKDVEKVVKHLTDYEISQALESNEIIVLGHTLKLFEDIIVVYDINEYKQNSFNLETVYDFTNNESFLVGINFATSTDMKTEGIAREIVSRVQKLKKTAKLTSTDKVAVYYSFVNNITDATLANVFLNYNEFITTAIKSEFRPLDSNPDFKNDNNVLISKIEYIKNVPLKFQVCDLN